MSGEEPQPFDCGLCLTRTGKVIKFFKRYKGKKSFQKFLDSQEKEGSKLLIHKKIIAYPSEMSDIVKRIYEEHSPTQEERQAYSAKKKEERKQEEVIEIRHEELKQFHAGSIVRYMDGNGRDHVAIVLRPGREKSLMAFLTTNPDWNIRSRRLTKDESALMGYPYKKDTTTYLAPVIRHNNCIHTTERLSFPYHRVRDMIREFQYDN